MCMHLRMIGYGMLSHDRIDIESMEIQNNGRIEVSWAHPYLGCRVECNVME